MVSLDLVRRIPADEMEERQLASGVGGQPRVETENLELVDREEVAFEDLS